MTMTDLPGVDEPVEPAEHLLNVGEVQAGGRLVEDVDAAFLGQVGGLKPLPLAAGQRRERLAEVTEANVGEPVEGGVLRCRRALLGDGENPSAVSFANHTESILSDFWWPWLQPHQDQEVAGTLRGRPGQRRRLDLDELALVQHPASDPVRRTAQLDRPGRPERRRPGAARRCR